MTDGSDPRVGRLKVLFIVGFTRSGSTILSNVLGELAGFFNGGEIQSSYWRKGALTDARCGCGRLFSDCDLWTEVSEVGFGGSSPSTLAAEETAAVQRHLMRNRNLPKLLRLSPGEPTGVPGLDDYLSRTARLYRAAARVSGARVIVDSSKWAPFAAVTRLVPGVDPYFVHLVRDPRAIAHSWRRRREGMQTLRPSQAAYQWSKWNVASLAVMRRIPRSHTLTVRYEEFATAPGAVLGDISRLVGEPVDASQVLIGSDQVRLGANHTLWGNPNRFARDVVRLQPDDEWRHSMPVADRRLVTAVASPALAALAWDRRRQSLQAR